MQDPTTSQLEDDMAFQGLTSSSSDTNYDQPEDIIGTEQARSLDHEQRWESSTESSVAVDGMRSQTPGDDDDERDDIKGRPRGQTLLEACRSGSSPSHQEQEKVSMFHEYHFSEKADEPRVDTSSYENILALDEEIGTRATDAEEPEPDSASEEAILDYTLVLDHVKSSRALVPGQTRVMRPVRWRKRPVNA